MKWDSTECEGTGGNLTGGNDMKRGKMRWEEVEQNGKGTEAGMKREGVESGTDGARTEGKRTGW